MVSIESDIEQWRVAVLNEGLVAESEAAELEVRLREQLSELGAAGLDDEEAFLIAIRRLARVDRGTAVFAREHSERAWGQPALSHPAADRWQPISIMLVFTAITAVLVQVARIFASMPDSDGAWLMRDLTLFVLPVLAAYFAILRRIPWPRTLVLAGVVAVLALAVNLFPFELGASTDLLVATHLPVALWFVVGVAYLGGDIRSAEARMNFIRFSGEWAIYYALIALGGGVLLGLTGLVLTPIAPQAMDGVLIWVLPSGPAGAVIVAAWLTEAKKNVVENIAPVLTTIFTPLFAVMLSVAVVVYTTAGVVREFDRELLTGFDVLLLVVLALVVYGISARQPSRNTRAMDVIRLVAVVAALVLDALVLVSMFARVGEFGFTANRVAALGLNLILLVNLAVTAWLIVRVLGSREQSLRLERWQTAYLPVFAAWVLLVVLVLPPLFGFA